MHSLYNRVAGQSVERFALRHHAYARSPRRCSPSSSIYRIALLTYWFNILLLGLMLFWTWSYATRARLLADDVPAEIHPAIIPRIVIAQSLYAAGAAFCFLNTYYSIAAIVLVQVNYAIAPRFCWGLFSPKAESSTTHIAP